MRKNDKKQHTYDLHFVKLEKWFSTPGIELWQKVLFYLLDWHIKHPTSKCFISNRKIHRDLLKCNCFCTEAGIEEAIRILKTSESSDRYSSGKKKKDGVGLIQCLYPHLNGDQVEYTPSTENILSKAEWTSLNYNPNKYIYRILRLNYTKLNKYLSVYTKDSHILKKLPAKSRLKKLVYKRPISYTKRIMPDFKRQMRESVYEKYKNPKQMFYSWIVLYSNKYYNTSIKEIIPDFARNTVKEQNSEIWLDAIESKLRGSPESEGIPKVVKDFFEAL